MEVLHPRPTARRGVALILSLSVLSILLTLGVTFVRVTSLERRAASQVVFATRARMACRAGVAYATARLRAEAARASYDRPDAAWRYGGEDLDGDGRLGLGEDSHAGGRLDVLACPLDRALRPSFAHPDNDARLADGLPAISGVRASPNGSFADAGAWSLPDGGRAGRGYYDTAFTLRVIDCAAMLDVNGGRFIVRDGRVVPARHPDPLYVAAVGQMIDRLWNLLRARAGLGGSYDLALGRHLREHLRRTGRSHYASTAELERAVRDISPDPAVGREVWRLAGPRLTVHAWRDPSVVRPFPQDTPKDGIRGRRTFGPLRLLPRAPVNINTADRVVLAAVFGGLEGHYTRELAADEVGENFDEPDARPSVRISTRTADVLARRIVRHRRDPVSGTVRPFRHWEDVERFFTAEVRAGTITDVQRDLLLAQAIPDTQLQAFNPDAIARRQLDKTDLTVWRTELCLSSMGRFEIRSLGRVTHRSATLAAAEASACVSVYDVHVDTTFADFERGQQFDTQVRPGISREAQDHPIASPLGHAPYDGSVALATTYPQPPRKPRYTTNLREHQGRDFVPLTGGRKYGLRLTDGRQSPNCSRTFSVGWSPSRWDRGSSLGAITWWYKPGARVDSSTLRPRSIASCSISAPYGICEIYLISGPDDPVAPGPGPPSVTGPRIVLLAWESHNDTEFKLELPLTGPDGLDARPGEWIHMALMWDSTKILLLARGRRGRPRPPRRVVDRSDQGGPLIVRQRLADGVLAMAHWPTDLSVEVPRWSADGALLPGPGRSLPPSAEMEEKRVRLYVNSVQFGRRVYRRPFVQALPSTDPPTYRWTWLSGNATFANFYSLDRTRTLEDARGRTALLRDPAAVLARADPDYRAIRDLFRAGRYHDGDGFRTRRRFARFRSDVVPGTAGMPLGTISWRGLRPKHTGFAVRVLRRERDTWKAVPHPTNARAPLQFDEPGACAIPRSIVDRGLRPAERLGAVRYEVHFVDRRAPGTGPRTTPILESVQLTVLSPTRTLEWRWL